VQLKMHFRVSRLRLPMQWKYHLPRSEVCVYSIVFSKNYFTEYSGAITLCLYRDNSLELKSKESLKWRKFRIEHIDLRLQKLNPKLGTLDWLFSVFATLHSTECIRFLCVVTSMVVQVILYKLLCFESIK
jgi:hypothetical protein